MLVQAYYLPTGSNGLEYIIDIYFYLYYLDSVPGRIGFVEYAKIRLIFFTCETIKGIKFVIK